MAQNGEPVMRRCVSLWSYIRPQCLSGHQFLFKHFFSSLHRPIPSYVSQTVSPISSTFPHFLAPPPSLVFCTLSHFRFCICYPTRGVWCNIALLYGPSGRWSALVFPIRSHPCLKIGWSNPGAHVVTSLSISPPVFSHSPTEKRLSLFHAGPIIQYC